MPEHANGRQEMCFTPRSCFRQRALGHRGLIVRVHTTSPWERPPSRAWAPSAPTCDGRRCNVDARRESGITLSFRVSRSTQDYGICKGITGAERWTCPPRAPGRRRASCPGARALPGVSRPRGQAGTVRVALPPTSVCSRPEGSDPFQIRSPFQNLSLRSRIPRRRPGTKLLGMTSPPGSGRERGARRGEEPSRSRRRGGPRARRSGRGGPA